ncbi:MAG: rhodanese-like domain-containing protein [Alphaproteobacteria bacterium]
MREYDIEVERLRELRDAAEPCVVVDVREAWEVEICAFDNARHIPLAELAGRLGEMPSAGPIVVLCHRGQRSARAVDFLRARGFPEAVNLRGGIDAWAARIDPAMARYD